MMEDKTEKKLLKEIEEGRKRIFQREIEPFSPEFYEISNKEVRLKQHRETKKETLQPIIDTIKARENKQHIGTLVRIMNYCKKEISNERKNI